MSAFIVFDWQCHQVLHVVKTGSLLSTGLKSRGIFFKNICLLFSLMLALLFLGGIFEGDRYNRVEFCIILFSIGTICFTGIYLYILHGRMVDHIDSSFNEGIENFGEEEQT